MSWFFQLFFSLWSFSRCFCCFSCLFSTAAACFLSSFFSLAFAFTINFIEVNQLDHCCFSIITRSCTQFDNTGITTWAASHFFSNCAEQFSDRNLIIKIAEYHTTLVCCVLFTLSDQWFYINTQCFCFSNCCCDPLVSDQSNCKIA